MAGFLDKIKQKVIDYHNKKNIFRLEVPSSDFVPYACHIDSKSIITKNGDILQVIKIAGFSDLAEKDNSEIRDVIRKALIKNIKSTDIGIWLHTIRTRRNIDIAGPFSNKISHFIHKEWVKKNYWNDKFINEIYITVVIRGQEFKLNTFSNIVNSLTFDSLTRVHNAYIKKIHKRLSEIVSNIKEDLKDCGAEILKIIKDENGIRSEPIEFFSKIINLKQEEMTVPIVDLSKYLINHKSAFGNNSFEIISHNGKYFGAIFTIKEYHESATKYLNNLLLLPEQMVITQTMGFIDKNKAEEQFKYQDYILDISLDAEFCRLMGLKRIMDNNLGGSTDFGDSQITIMISAETQEKLAAQIKRISQVLGKNGFMYYREDLAMEDLFWSQLPGNFSFVRRKSPLPFSILGGFLSLNNYPAGRTTSKWGKPITIFRTNNGTPYFFNFHDKSGKGHTLLLGPKNSYKSAIARFIMSESSHLDVKCLYFYKDPNDVKFTTLFGAKNFNSTDLMNVELSELSKFSSLQIGESFIMDLRAILNKVNNNLESKVLIIIEDINSAYNMNKDVLNAINDLITIENSNIVIMALYNSDTDIGINKDFFDKFATKIYTPDAQIMNKTYMKPLTSVFDINLIKSLNPLYKHFLIKQDNDNVVLEFNVTGLDDVVNILNGNDKDLKYRELLA